jgi:hypothetical protein
MALMRMFRTASCRRFQSENTTKGVGPSAWMGKINSWPIVSARDESLSLRSNSVVIGVCVAVAKVLRAWQTSIRYSS